ncbi:MAG: hypothetical protein IPN71_08825 [Fibrobacteres bacterium]|nr:hypothetical protein [Fibrobacterota bacterium]
MELLYLESMDGVIDRSLHMGEAGKRRVMRKGQDSQDCAVASALLFGPGGHDLAVEPAEYTGRWALDRDRSDDLEKAVDRALEPENLVTRMMASQADPEVRQSAWKRW